MKNKRALICVDLQKDFCPGGSLPVNDGDKIMPLVNNLISKFDLVIFTKDWHAPDMECFVSQHPDAKPFDLYWPMMRNGSDFHPDTQETMWPDHCVEGTEGAEFHADLDLSKCAKDFYIFKKGTDKYYQAYSGFDGTELEEFLKEREVTDVYVCGLAGDYCVCETAVDAAFAEFNTYFIIDATKFIGDKDETLIKLQEAGVKIIESWELPLANL